jgi:hypothetical protein
VIDTHTVSLPRRPVDAEKLGYFRFGALAGGIILTTDHGRWHHLSEADFRALLAGSLEPGHAEYDALAAKGFLRDQLALDDMAAAIRSRRRYVGVGPVLHTLQLANAAGERLSVETGKDVLDHVMLSTSHALELQLVAPAGTWDGDLLMFLLQYGTEKNRYEGKTITWKLVTDLANLPEKADAWLVDKRVVVRARFDGPAGLHDAQRAWSGAAEHATVSANIARLHALAATRNRDELRVEADVVVGAANAPHPEQVAQALVDAGVRKAVLQPRLQGEGAIDLAAWSAFADGFIGACAAHTRAGHTLVDVHTATVLTRALRAEPGAAVAWRSPSAAGLGQLVYDVHGHIFPSEAALRMHADGDDMFLLGKAGVLSYKDCVAHPTLRTLAVASTIESLPGFADHWAAPFCGVDPTSAFAATGDLFARTTSPADVAAQLAAVGVVFQRLVQATDADLAALAKWLE